MNIILMMNTKGYFSGEVRVLLPNGVYKDISAIKIGDLVLNLRNEPVKVTNVFQCPETPMIEVRYQNWYTPLYCTKNLQLLIADAPTNDNPSLEEVKWVSAENLNEKHNLTSEKHVYSSLLPNDFFVDIAVPGKKLVLTPSFDLGFIFGLYSGYGSIIDGSIVFRFGPNDDLVEQVEGLLKNLFDATADVEKNKFCYTVRSNCVQLLELFEEFGSKLERKIPQKYWSSNQEYITGLFSGLVDYEPNTRVNRYIPVTKDMAEVFFWCCSLLGLTFENDTTGIKKVYPMSVKDKQDDAYLGSVLHVNTEHRTLQEGWNISVDCPTESFIANNVVVKAIPNS